MRVTRQYIPRANVNVNVQVSHCSMSDDDAGHFEEMTIIVEPYWNAAEVMIGHASLSIPEFAIPEVIRMLRKYQKNLAAARRAQEAKGKK